MKSKDLIRFLSADLERYYRVSGNRSYGRISRLQIWSRLLSPRCAPVVLYRLACCLHSIRLSIVAKVVSIVNYSVFGIEVSSECHVGPGLLLPHTQGTVIGAQTIGKNATIFQGVTLGAKEIDFQCSIGQRPTIGDDVVIGAGAKVLGGISIGDKSIIGANSVVLVNIPPRSIAVGVPARVIKQRIL